MTSKAETIKAQAQAVAQTGRSNMFDTKAVFEIALELGFDELADFIFMNRAAYSKLILTGELNEADIVESL
jgi:hypothetical protein